MSAASEVRDISKESWEADVLKPAHTKDVMVLFYDARRSVFKNIFDGVARKFPSSSVVFAQYDCEGHDPSEVPEPFNLIAHDMVNFPAIYFYRQGEDPEQYEGLRQTDDIVEWIQNHPAITHPEL